MKKLISSLELPNPTRNTRKFANKLMADSSGEINLQSKQVVICHVAKVKPATSVHYVADAIPFFAIPFFVYDGGVTTDKKLGLERFQVVVARNNFKCINFACCKQQKLFDM